MIWYPNRSTVSGIPGMGFCLLKQRKPFGRRFQAFLAGCVCLSKSKPLSKTTYVFAFWNPYLQFCFEVCPSDGGLCAPSGTPFDQVEVSHDYL